MREEVAAESWEVEGEVCSRGNAKGAGTLRILREELAAEEVEEELAACSLQLWSSTHAIANTLWAYATVGIKRVMRQMERQEEAM